MYYGPSWDRIYNYVNTTCRLFLKRVYESTPNIFGAKAYNYWNEWVKSGKKISDISIYNAVIYEIISECKSTLYLVPLKL